MIEIISGEKGKGKTKYLLDKVKADVKTAEGSIVFVDKDDKHMFGVDPKVRLINFSEYKFGMENIDEFIGFICGIISQDHDLEKVYLDSFLRIAKLEGRDLDVESAVVPVLAQLASISTQFSVDFIISISLTREQLPSEYHDMIVAQL